MSEATINYEFDLEDDATAKFKEWRKSINGITNSNFIKADKILAEKSDKSVSVESTLAAGSWVGLNAPFTQKLVVTGLGAMQNGNVSIAHSATFVQRKAARDAILSITGQEDGKLIITADGVKPVVDIPVVTVLLG